MADQQPPITRAFAADPELVTQLLAKHIPDSSGRCSTCRDHDQAPKWPCRIRAIADAAQELIDRQERRTARHDQILGDR